MFAADIKGDLSGVATPGEANEKLLARTRAIGQDWKPAASVTEYFALGGIGKGVPVRATVSGFGPLLLSKVLGLNETQESSLGLVFHYADANGLALVDLSDLRAVLTLPHRRRGQGRAQGPRRAVGGDGGRHPARAHHVRRRRAPTCSSASRSSTCADFLRTAPDGRGIISLLEVPGVVDKPALFSTFLMYLLAELFEILPEVGDARQAEAGVLLRRGAPALQGRVEGLPRRDRADRAAHPLEGRRRLLRHADAEGRALRRARAARLARAARAARLHPRRREGAARDRRHLPEVGLRPRARAAGARHRRGDRHGDEREGRADARSRGRGCAPRRGSCRRRPSRRSTPR